MVRRRLYRFLFLEDYCLMLTNFSRHFKDKAVWCYGVVQVDVKNMFPS